MQTVGIIGGIAPESTIDYYRSILATYRARRRDDSTPRILINSIDLRHMLSFVETQRLDDLTSYLLGEIELLARAGADFGILASNTPHIVFDDLHERSRLPLLSIVAITRDAARAAGFKRLGLFGTRFTMQGRFYPDLFSRSGMELIVPTPEEQAIVHAIYMTELVNGIVRDESRATLLAIAQRLESEERIDALILGGTELPLLFRGSAKPPVPFLDTTQLHVEQVVALLLS